MLVLSELRNMLSVTKYSVLILVVLLASLQFSGISSVYSNGEAVSTFEDAVVQAESNTVYFVFPDHDPAHKKPPGVGQAWLSDWTAIGFLYGMCANMPQNIAPDTRTSLFSNVDGSPQISDAVSLLFGGPLVSVPDDFYEEERLAPVYWQNDDDTYYWYTSDGTRIDRTAMPFTDLVAGDQDMFVVETFTDNSNNRIFIIYGYGWKATFAGGKFFKSIIYPDLESYTCSFYIFKWADSNGDGFVDLDEIITTPVASGWLDSCKKARQPIFSMSHRRQRELAIE